MSNDLVPASDLRTAFAVNRDMRARAPGDSPLGIQHGERCEHNAAPATCLLCIYGEPGNKVLIDMAAFDYAADIEEQRISGDTLDPVQVAEQAYRAGAAMGMSSQRDSDVARGVIATRAGAVDPKSLLHTMVALESGQISKEDALRAVFAWQESTLKELAGENAGPTAKALTSG